MTYALIAACLALAITTAITIDARTRRPARERADEIEAAGLRLLADGVDIHAIDASGPARGTVYTSSAAVHDRNEHEPYAPLSDVWMVKAVTVDPTLTATDVATAVEHVAPGVGSMASFAAAMEDTRMRTSAQLRELQAAELEAYAEALAQEDRLFFAAYDRRMARELARFDEATARVDQWEAYQHRDNEHECVHCRRAVKETSDEYRLIRSLDDTGAISRADIDALYAAHAVAA